MTKDKDSQAEFQQLDFSQFSFPSDQINIAVLRKIHPEAFDHGFIEGAEAQPKYFMQPDLTGHATEGIGILLFCERLMATHAYANAIGREGPKDWDRQIVRDKLIDSYCSYGLATGPSHAKELVRDVERQGANLAQQKGI